MSPEMRGGAARRKGSLPADIASRITFGAGDVRSVRTGRKHDVVISLFHVISYQTDAASLDAMFETAHAHLDRGGLFLFDFWYGPAVLTQKPDVRVRRLEDEQIAVTRIAEPQLHANDNVVDVNYDVFIREKATGRVEEVREKHRMRYLFQPELAALRNGRFDERASHDWLTEAPMTERSWAGVQVLSKI
jgi:hypothetical protein